MQYKTNFNSLLEDIFDWSVVTKTSSNYPPYNLTKQYQDYKLDIAVAGFSKSDLTLELTDNTLSIIGTKESTEQDPNIHYLHRQLALRSFKLQFKLGPNVELDMVKGVTLTNGILSIMLVNKPEEKKTRKVEIND